MTLTLKQYFMSINVFNYLPSCWKVAKKMLNINPEVNAEILLLFRILLFRMVICYKRLFILLILIKLDLKDIFLFQEKYLLC